MSMQLRRRRTGPLSFLNSASRAITKYGPRAFSLARSFRNSVKSSSNSRSIIAPGPVTSEHDFKTRYRKRRMPRRKRKAWKRFSRKVRAVLYSNLGLRVAKVVSPGYIWAAVDTTTFYSANLYPTSGIASTVGTLATTSGTGNYDDLLKIFARENSSASVIKAGDKFMFQSACLDVLLTNLGSTPTIIECYYWQANDTLGDLAAEDSLEELYTNGFTSGHMTGIGGGTALSATAPGTTPFNNPAFCHFVKIIKKTQILLSPSATTTLQLRDPKNHRLTGEAITQSAIRRGLTRGIFFQFYGAPTSANSYSSASLKIFTTRIYNYYALEDNTASGVAIS